MNHPIDAQNKVQKAFLESLPRKDRSYHKKLFSVGNAELQYHLLTKKHKPTKKDYNEWLNGLDEVDKQNMKERGFESCKTDFTFTQFVLEKKNIGKDEWMKKNLTKAEYSFYLNQ